jgi:hypothetical protein
VGKGQKRRGVETASKTRADPIAWAQMHAGGHLARVCRSRISREKKTRWSRVGRTALAGRGDDATGDDASIGGALGRKLRAGRGHRRGGGHGRHVRYVPARGEGWSESGFKTQQIFFASAKRRFVGGAWSSGPRRSRQGLSSRLGTLARANRRRVTYCSTASRSGLRRRHRCVNLRSQPPAHITKNNSKTNQRFQKSWFSDCQVVLVSRNYWSKRRLGFQFIQTDIALSNVFLSKS